MKEKLNVKLPDIYEQYFLYLAHTREISQKQITSVRRVLISLNDYLENHNTQTPSSLAGYEVY